MWDMQNIRELIRDRTLRVMPEDITPDNSDFDEAEVFPETRSIEQATIVTSAPYGLVTNTWHYPVIDLDFEAFLVPSSTPGHYHLYLNRLVPWRQYKKILKAMRDAGLIEDGFYRASVKRGYTSARLPWIKKETPV